MKLERLNRIHFVGVSGIGMSGIAEFLLTMGYKISGSDLRATDITERLSAMGAKIFKGHSASNIQDVELVVYSSAVPLGNPEILEAKRRGIPVIQRGEMLAELTRIKDSVIVAGSHGKTTVTAMIAHIASSLNFDPSVIIGGRLSSIGGTAKLGKSNLLIAEADESDRSFLLLFPSLAIITNIDHEHIDTYPTIDSLKDAYIQFANRAPFYGVVIACGDDYHTREAIPKFKRKTLTYGILPGADWCGEKISTDLNGETFRVWKNSKEKETVKIQQKGTHNILNAIAALAASFEMDIPLKQAAEAISSFPGVDRRFQFIGRENKIDFYDDYAHHPSEVRALLETARIAAGNRRIVIAFQPHRFTRLKAFEDAFARVLLQSDLLFITEVYSAAEPPIPGISGEALYKRIKELGHTNCYYVSNVADLPQRIIPLLNENDLVITAGAGNITSVCPQIISLLKGKG